jgi:hypothetical protein
MAYPRIFPTLYDEVLTLDTKSYKVYLKPNQLSTGVSRWTRNGEVTARIGFTIHMEATSGYLELDYTFNEKPLKYRVPIVSKPNNLGIGLIWYFVCPVTKKHCRKLYLVGGYFLHREAFTGCMYKKQTKSKSSRPFTKMLDQLFAKSDFMEGREKYFKTHYQGKPTKNYLKFLKLQEKERQAMRPAGELFKRS